MPATLASHWIWPLLTALVGLAFTGLVLRQYLSRRHAQQLAWSAGLFFYALGAMMEFYSEFVKSWDPTVYRFYYVIAAVLVSCLGLGTIYLIFKRRMWGHIYLGYIAVMNLVFLGFALTTPLITANLVPGITVGGKAMPETVRIFSFLNTIPGSLALFGGAIYSIILFATKRQYSYRMWANVFIAAGTLVIAAAGSMARTAVTIWLYPAEMVGAALLLVGFLKAGTIRKEAASQPAPKAP